MQNTNNSISCNCHDIIPMTKYSKRIFFKLFMKLILKILGLIFAIIGGISLIVYIINLYR